ncbi:hypothetical protein MFIFM68171_06678 [Madurella fahalii]|uniref:Uncharacterized protein n=1 Tax=Madurella fahalii TaxID=1157608 RepID=A0ABQ0GFD1_9PEZI
MKFEALLTFALLTGAATAIGPSSPKSPPRLRGKREKMENWKWSNPFESPLHKKFDAACEVERLFKAEEYLLDDLSESGPGGLLAYRDALKQVFAMREYPGSWDGIDPHGYDRNLLMMGYDEMPLKVREWIEEQERTDGPGKGLFAVYNRPMTGTRALHTIKIPAETPVSEEWRAKDDRRVALFAPGALYEVLPLWVAEGSGCEDSLLDTSKYSAKLADGGVVAYPINWTWAKRGQGKRDIEFRVKAQVLKLKPGENAVEDAEEVVEKTEAEKVDKTETASDNDKTEKVEKAEDAEKPASTKEADKTEKDEKDEL